MVDVRATDEIDDVSLKSQKLIVMLFAFERNSG